MFDAKNTILVVIDIQGKLASLMHQRDDLFANTSGLIKAAQILKIPIIVTEQVPEKIGCTIPEISEHFKKFSPIEKKSFSCYQEKKFKRQIDKSKRKQVVICGIETHVCVYQTAADLASAEYQVQVVADAVSSRTKENKALALKRIENAGATLTSTEMIICELTKGAHHKNFREIIQLLKN